MADLHPDNPYAKDRFADPSKKVEFSPEAKKKYDWILTRYPTKEAALLPTLHLAQEVLKNILDHDEKVVTIEIIQKFVADYYQLKLAELKSRNNSKSVAIPRQIAMYLCKHLTNASLPEIGRSFGGKHHSTVIHSIRKVEDIRRRDGDFNTLINNFLESFR